MCCLGFYGKACGLSDASIAEHADYTSPTLVDSIPDEMMWLVEEYKSPINGDVEMQSSDQAEALIGANDIPNYLNTLRERIIKGLFAKQGIEVEFVD